jgi:hypothetical protein
MTLNMRNPETERLAAGLARLTGEGKTEASPGLSGTAWPACSVTRETRAQGQGNPSPSEAVALDAVGGMATAASRGVTVMNGRQRRDPNRNA